MIKKPSYLAIKIALYMGGFSTMALSNAVVPVLNDMTSDPALQGAVYSAYFFGAFATVFAAGWLSDKIGTKPLIKAGLIGTFVSAVLLWALYPDIYFCIAMRFTEGLFTGVLISTSTSYINTLREPKMLGGYVALMNLGMVAGYGVCGFTALISPRLGILLFGVLVGLSMVATLLIMRGSQKECVEDKEEAKLASLPKVLSLSKQYLWIWVGYCVFTGTTGVAASMYPEMSGYSPEIIGIITSFMNIATVVAIFFSSGREYFSRLSSIRLCAVLLAVSFPFVCFTPVAMPVFGAFYGVICVSILNYIAKTPEPHGVMNGLYYTAQYAGMALLPFILGFTVPAAGYLAAFVITAVLCIVCGILIVRRGIGN